MSFPTKEHILAAQSSAEYWYAKAGVYAFPSVRLAQTGIESANGTALSGANNYWGVKANKAQIAAGKYKLCRTREVINGKSVYIMDKFASYDSLEEGYIKQAELLVTSKIYEASRHDTDPHQYLIDIAKHYATDPRYAAVVWGYMQKNKLLQYDHPAHSPILVDNPPLKPPVNEQKKVQAPAVAGAVVAGASAAAAAASSGGFHLNMGLLIAGVLVGGICAAFAVLKAKNNKAVLDQMTASLSNDEADKLAASFVKVAPEAPVPAIPAPTPVVEPAH